MRLRRLPSEILWKRLRWGLLEVVIFLSLTLTAVFSGHPFLSVLAMLCVVYDLRVLIIVWRQLRSPYLFLTDLQAMMDEAGEQQ